MKRKLAPVMMGPLLLSLIAFAGCGKKTQTTTPKVPDTTPSTTSDNTVTAKSKRERYIGKKFPRGVLRR